MPAFNITATPVDNAPGTHLTVGFGEPGDNTQIVRDCDVRLQGLNLQGGQVCLVEGPASLCAAFVLAHRLIHLYQTVAVWDPKLASFVVVASHGGHELGDLLSRDAYVPLPV